MYSAMAALPTAKLPIILRHATLCRMFSALPHKSSTNYKTPIYFISSKLLTLMLMWWAGKKRQSVRIYGSLNS